MAFFRRKNPREPKEALETEMDLLREKVAQLEADLELLRQKNAELVREASPALKENAVLRYELFKCQTDRQVLEFHLSGLRAELRGALALLRRLAPGEPPKGEPPLEALLDLLEVGRRLGVPLEAFRRAEEGALSALGGPRAFRPERFLLLRLAGVLAALERLLDEELDKAGRPGEGLLRFPEPLESVREALAQGLAAWGEEGS